MNKKEVRKRLKLERKEYITEKGKKIPERKPMQWVEWKCRNKCAENLDIDERKLLHIRYWSIGSDNERRQYILAMTSTKDPARRTTKQRENSPRKQTSVFFLNKNNNDKVEVCANVFFSTLQVTRKFIRCTHEHATPGFNKPDSRGRHSSKHKLTYERREKVIANINSFPKVPGYYVRKSSQKIYVEDTTNFSKLTLAKMHKLSIPECHKEGVDNSVSVPTYKDILHSQK